jgi:hypothetical protein
LSAGGCRIPIALSGTPLSSRTPGMVRQWITRRATTYATVPGLLRVNRKPVGGLLAFKPLPASD